MKEIQGQSSRRKVLDDQHGGARDEQIKEVSSRGG